MCVCVPQNACGWISKDSLGKLVFSSYHLVQGSNSGSQVLQQILQLAELLLALIYFRIKLDFDVQSEFLKKHIYSVCLYVHERACAHTMC